MAAKKFEILKNLVRDEPLEPIFGLHEKLCEPIFTSEMLDPGLTILFLKYYLKVSFLLSAW